MQSINARKFVALAVFGEVALRLSLEWLQGPLSADSAFGGTFASTLLWAYLAYAVHAQILLPHDRNYTTVSARVFGFALRTLGIAIVVGIAFSLGAFVPAKIIGAAGVAVMLAMIMLGFPVFVWLATLLPAYVAGRARGVNAAIERGKAQFGWIAGRLLIGPCLLFLLSSVLYSQLVIPTDEKSLF